MTYREPDPAPKPAAQYIDRSGAKRPANRIDVYAHRLFCRPLNGIPIRLPDGSAGKDDGFDALCHCGLIWAGDLS